MNAEDELIPTRASLLGRLKDWKDEASWKVFFETYWKLIYNAAIKAGLTDAEAQDVVQETVISVSKSMPSFEYDAVGGSFKSWLLKLTAWRIVDQKRRRDVRPAQRRSDSTTRTATVERIADPAESGQPFRFGYLGRGQLCPINALPASFPDFLLDFQ